MRITAKTKNSIQYLVAIMVFILTSQALSATNYYVTFKDGRLHVFPDSCIESKSSNGMLLSFTALDGIIYSYPMDAVSSVSTQLQKKLPDITSFKFNNKYNYQVFTDADGVIDGNEIRVQVAGIGKWLTPSFSLSDESATAFVDGMEQVSKQSRMRFSPSRVYTVGYPGDLILTPQPKGGYAMEPFGSQYIVSVDFLTDHSTRTPRIDINTVDGVNITSKEYYVDAEIIIDGAGVFPSMTDSVKIKGRGNSSWSNNPNSKNPYRLKFVDKVKPFGLTKGKSWVLLANKIKGSMLTNAIGMKAASLMGTVAANHIIPVDLYINGTYKGSYNFTEKVGFANNSVDLDDEQAAALLELDLYYDEIAGQKFKSMAFKLPVNVKEPEFSEGTTLLTLNDIKRRFNAFDSAVHDGEDITAHVAIDPLARYLLFNDYICNLELYHPKSTFCFYENVLDNDSLLKFGPVWDLDWAFGFDGSHAYSYFNRNVNCDYFLTLTTDNFFNYLGNNPQVDSCMMVLMMDFMKNGLDELCDYCLEYYKYAKPSFMNNKAASLDATDYEDQAAKAVDWLRARADHVWEELKPPQSLPGDVNGDREVNIGDVTALTGILLGGYADDLTLQRADVNGDGEISVADINSLIDLILGE